MFGASAERTSELLEREEEKRVLQGKGREWKGRPGAEGAAQLLVNAGFAEPGCSLPFFRRTCSGVDCGASQVDCA